MKAFTWFLIMLIAVSLIALASIGIAKLLIP
jgi:hypothetical protein